MEILGLLFPLGLVGVVLASTGIYRRGQAKELIAYCEHASDVSDVELGLLGGVKAKVTRGAFVCNVYATLPGKNTPGTWRCSIDGIAIAQRTTFSLANEGVLSGLASAVGFNDIQLGDRALDDLLRIKGSDEDVVRALFLDDEVQAVALAALGAGAAFGGPLRLVQHGTLTYATRRKGYNYSTMRQRTDTMLDLAEALHKKRGIRPVPAPTKALPPKGGVGGSSGAPLGVRVN